MKMDDLFSNIVNIVDTSNRLYSKQIKVEPLARVSDPVTSHEAAERHKLRANTNARRVFDAVVSFPDSTACELGEITALGHIEAQRRLSDLKRKGIVAQGEVKICNIKNSRMVTWKETTQ
jgi:hypothetical protein